MVLKRINKKGFSLVETLVAMVIVFIVSFCAYSTVVFANTTLAQNKIINFAINDIKNVTNILDASGDFNSFSLSDFNTNINWLYDNNVTYTNIDENNKEYVIKKDSNNNYDDDSIFSLHFNLQTSSNAVTLQAKVYKNDKIIYELKDDYVKVISWW